MKTQNSKNEYFTISKLKGLSDKLDVFISNFEILLSKFSGIKNKENIVDNTPIYFIHTEMIEELYQRINKLEETNKYLLDKIKGLERIPLTFPQPEPYIGDGEPPIRNKKFILRKTNSPDDYYNPPTIMYKNGETLEFNSGFNVTKREDELFNNVINNPPF